MRQTDTFSPKDISEMLNLPLSSITKIYEGIQD